MKKNIQLISKVKGTFKWQLLVTAIIITITYSCSHKMQSTTASAVVPITNPTPEQLELGKSIYTTKCHKCHKQHESTEFTAEKWNKMITKMAVKAKLTDEQREEVRAYILSSPLHQ